jgi:hypothetical protein
MQVANELATVKKISWGSVIGGVITVLAVSLLLSTLGTSLGFSIVDPTSGRSGQRGRHYCGGLVCNFDHPEPGCRCLYCRSSGSE